MIYKTHMAFAVLASEPIVYFLIKENYIETMLGFATFMGVLMFASIFPDLDEPHSRVSRFFPFNILSYILSLFVRHRGFTHNFCGITFFTLIPFTISLFIFPLQITIIYFLPWLIGYILHIIGDSMTLSGVTNFFCGKWLFMKKQFTLRATPKILSFRTNSYKETILYYIIISSIIGSIYYFTKIGLFSKLINNFV